MPMGQLSQLMMRPELRLHTSQVVGPAVEPAGQVWRAVTVRALKTYFAPRRRIMIASLVGGVKVVFDALNIFEPAG
jgi:hypothetical protein